MIVTFFMFSYEWLPLWLQMKFPLKNIGVYNTIIDHILIKLLDNNI
jgi:hypothetical protein